MKSLLIASLVSLPVLASATAFAEVTAGPVASPVATTVSWRATHVYAAESFDRWVAQDPDAKAVVAFTTDHPGRTKMLIAWALENQTGNLADFNFTHKNLAGELAKTPDGAAHLLNWARENAEAAKLLSEAPRGFGATVAQK